MQALPTLGLEAQVLAHIASVEAVSALIAAAELRIVEQPDEERFGARYVAKLVSPSGMVWRETFPSNSLEVIAQRVARWAA